MPDEPTYPLPDDPAVFNSKAGRKLLAKEVRQRIIAYRADEESRGHKRGAYTESEFFGVDTIQHLITQNPGCIGIRFYYGINAKDDDGDNVRRLILVAVDAQGKDLSALGNLHGLKDPGDDETVGDGITCPRHCPT